MFPSVLLCSLLWFYAILLIMMYEVILLESFCGLTSHEKCYFVLYFVGQAQKTHENQVDSCLFEKFYIFLSLLVPNQFTTFSGF